MNQQRLIASYLLLLTSYLLSGCSLINNFSNGGFDTSKNPDVYHIGTHWWSGDTIVVHAYKTADTTAPMSARSLTVECMSCNIIEKAFDVAFDNAGNGRIYIPEARSLLSVRLHLVGKGIDTTIIHKQRPPQEATTYFGLTNPLTGRVLINQFAVLYRDTTQDSVMSNANLGDELNIYGEAKPHSHFLVVHHPNFREPLYLLKEDAVRLY
jgi:hypothetical protein